MPPESTQAIATIDSVLTITSVFFIVEAVLKIMGQGMLKHKNAYLKDGWNRLDFLVVLTSALEIIISVGQMEDELPSFKVLRSLRVLRPLRSVKRVPSMRRLVSIMLRSLPELGNTLVFLLFFFIVFGIIGIQTFHGNIYRRCRLWEQPANGRWPIDPEQSHFICTRAPGESNSCRAGTYCGSPLADAPEPLDPLIDDPWSDPKIMYNAINFNDLYAAIICVFETLTMEGWSLQMINLIESGTWVEAALFYILQIAFGSYFILNLILAVIMGSFSKFEQKEIEEKLKQAEEVEMMKVRRSDIEDGNEEVGHAQQRARPADRSQDGSQSSDHGTQEDSGDHPRRKRGPGGPAQAQEEGGPRDQSSSRGEHEKEIKDKKDKKGKKVERQQSATSQDSQFSFKANKKASDNTRRNDYKIDQTPISQIDESQNESENAFAAVNSSSNLPNHSKMRQQGIEHEGSQSSRKVMKDSSYFNQFDQDSHSRGGNVADSRNGGASSKASKNSKSSSPAIYLSNLDNDSEALNIFVNSQDKSNCHATGAPLSPLTPQSKMQSSFGKLQAVPKYQKQHTNLEPVREQSIDYMKDKEEQIKSEAAVRERNVTFNEDHDYISSSEFSEKTSSFNKLTAEKQDNNEKLFQNQNNQNDSTKNKISQRSILEISDEEEYSNDYYNFKKIAKPMQSKYYTSNPTKFHKFEGGASEDHKYTDRSSLEDSHKVLNMKEIKRGNEDALRLDRQRPRESASKKIAQLYGREGKRDHRPEPGQSSTSVLGSSFSRPTGKRILRYFKYMSIRQSKKYQYTGIYKFFNYICTSQLFVFAILGCICLNTVTLSLDRYPIDPEENAMLEQINTWTTFIFVGELCIKVLGLGVRTYAMDGMNRFDAIVVTISIVEYVLSQERPDQSYSTDHALTANKVNKENMSLTIFRGFRLLRVFRLARRWHSFHKMMVKIYQTVQDVVTFFVLLLIMVFVFSLLGVQLFAGYAAFNEDGEVVQKDDPTGSPPRLNFGSFWAGMVCVFVCLIGEDWQLIMHDYIRGQQTIYVPSLFFIALMVIGNLFLMNLFLAILLKNFEEKKQETDDGGGECGAPKHGEHENAIEQSVKSLRSKLTRMFTQRDKAAPLEVLEVDGMAEGSDGEGSGRYFQNNTDPLGPQCEQCDDPPELHPRPKSSSYKIEKVHYVDSESRGSRSSASVSGPADNDDIFGASLQDQQATEKKGHHSDYRAFELNQKGKAQKKVNKASKQKQEGAAYEGGGREAAKVAAITAGGPAARAEGPAASRKTLIAGNAGKDMTVVQKGQAMNFITTLKANRSSIASSKLIDTRKTVALEGRSLYLFSPENKFRSCLSKLVVHSMFESFIFGFVLISAVLIGLEDPLADPDRPALEIIALTNRVITGIFTAELLMKIIVFGLIANGKDAYLQNGWNILDFIIVSTSIASLMVEGLGDGTSSAAQDLELLKMLRVLRSLRMISRQEGLKLSVLSLIYSMPGIINVTVVTLLFFLLCGIFFLNMLKGKFYNCKLHSTLEDHIDIRNKIDTLHDCYNYGGIWVNKIPNFDTIPSAVLSLFTMSTTEGWVSFMNDAVDSVGIGLQPESGTNAGLYTYIFIFYMIFGSLFITNLFIEVVINTFDKEKSKIDRNFMLTNFQKEWIQLQLKCYDVRPKTKVNTKSYLRRLCLRVVEYQHFDAFIMSVILLNACALVLKGVSIPQPIITGGEAAQHVFSGIFVAECALKITAYQKFYFYNGWNIFDFFVVVGGSIGAVQEDSPAAALSVFRILRVCRVLRLLKKAKRLYIIFNSFIHTIPAFVNVGSLILVMIYIFSTLGNRMFAKVMLHGALTRHVHFQTFGSSFQTLIIVMTGEGWYEIMGSLSQRPAIDFDCIEQPSYELYAEHGRQTLGCGIGYTAEWFFVAFVFSVSLILVNLFVAVTLQGFNDVQREDSCRITDYQIQIFIDAWTDLDPDGTGYIHISEAGKLMKSLIQQKCELFPPKAKDLVYDPVLLTELIEHLQLKLYKKFQYYNFHDILISLSEMYLTNLASRENELKEVLSEHQTVHEVEAHNLDDVIRKIEDIQKEKNVQMCKKLDQALIAFKNSVLSKIDRFEGNIYTSSMIPIVLKIQAKFRKRRQEKLEKARELRQYAKSTKYRKGMLLGEKEIDRLLGGGDHGHGHSHICCSRKGEAGERGLGAKQAGLRKEISPFVNQDGQNGDAGEQFSITIPSNIKTINVFNSRRSYDSEVSNKDSIPKFPQKDDQSAPPEKRTQAKGLESKKPKNVQLIRLENYRTFQPDEVKEALRRYSAAISSKPNESRDQPPLPQPTHTIEKLQSEKEDKQSNQSSERKRDKGVQITNNKQNIKQNQEQQRIQRAGQMTNGYLNEDEIELSEIDEKEKAPVNKLLFKEEVQPQHEQVFCAQDANSLSDINESLRNSQILSNIGSSQIPNGFKLSTEMKGLPAQYQNNWVNTQDDRNVASMPIGSVHSERSMDFNQVDQAIHGDSLEAVGMQIDDAADGTVLMRNGESNIQGQLALRHQATLTPQTNQSNVAQSGSSGPQIDPDGSARMRKKGQAFHKMRGGQPSQQQSNNNNNRPSARHSTPTISSERNEANQTAPVSPQDGNHSNDQIQLVRNDSAGNEVLQEPATIILNNVRSSSTDSPFKQT